MKALPEDPFGPAVLDEFEGKGYAYEERKLWTRQVNGVFLYPGSHDKLSRLIQRGKRRFTGTVYRTKQGEVETLQVKVLSVRQEDQFNRVRFQADA